MLNLARIDIFEICKIKEKHVIIRFFSWKFPSGKDILGDLNFNSQAIAKSTCQAIISNKNYHPLFFAYFAQKFPQKSAKKLAKKFALKSPKTAKKQPLIFIPNGSLIVSLKIAY